MWFDPIVVPVSSQQVQVVFCTNFMAMIPEIAPGSKSTCGLSNVSNGAPEKLRPILNQVYLCMLRHNSLKVAILDALDKDILSIAKNDNHPMQKLVDRLMNGETIDSSSLNSDVNLLLSSSISSFLSTEDVAVLGGIAVGKLVKTSKNL